MPKGPVSPLVGVLGILQSSQGSVVTSTDMWPGTGRKVLCTGGHGGQAMGARPWNIRHHDNTVMRIRYRQDAMAAVVMVPFTVKCEHTVTCFTLWHPWCSGVPLMHSAYLTVLSPPCPHRTELGLPLLVSSRVPRAQASGFPQDLPTLPLIRVFKPSRR